MASGTVTQVMTEELLIMISWSPFLYWEPLLIHELLHNASQNEYVSLRALKLLQTYLAFFLCPLGRFIVFLEHHNHGCLQQVWESDIYLTAMDPNSPSIQPKCFVPISSLFREDSNEWTPCKPLGTFNPINRTMGHVLSTGPEDPRLYWHDESLWMTFHSLPYAKSPFDTVCPTAGRFYNVRLDTENLYLLAKDLSSKGCPNGMPVDVRSYPAALVSRPGEVDEVAEKNWIVFSHADLGQMFIPSLHPFNVYTASMTNGTLKLNEDFVYSETVRTRSLVTFMDKFVRAWSVCMAMENVLSCARIKKKIARPPKYTTTHGHAYVGSRIESCNFERFECSWGYKCNSHGACGRCWPSQCAEWGIQRESLQNSRTLLLVRFPHHRQWGRLRELPAGVPRPQGLWYQYESSSYIRPSPSACDSTSRCIHWKADDLPVFYYPDSGQEEGR